jgi:uncharacterized membrane protein YGL010W
MKSIQTWLDEYGVSHQNHTNKMIHWVCVPLIFFSIMGLFYALKLPFQITETLQANVALVLLLAVTVYYFTLSRTLWIGMFLFAILCGVGCYFIESTGVSLPLVSVVIFVLAWIGQFYGHKVEGIKPSFFKDLQFLMIGPAWLMSFIYKKLGVAY